jgi:hypothetical protein
MQAFVYNSSHIILKSKLYQVIPNAITRITHENLKTMGVYTYSWLMNISDLGVYNDKLTSPYR